MIWMVNINDDACSGIHTTPKAEAFAAQHDVAARCAFQNDQIIITDLRIFLSHTFNPEV